MLADGESKIPPSFNLTSALYHAGAAIAVTHESPHGLADEAHPFSYDQILEIHHILFQTAAEKLVPGVQTSVYQEYKLAFAKGRSPFRSLLRNKAKTALHSCNR